MKKKFNSGWMEEKDSLLIFSFFLRIDFLSSQNFLSVRSLYKSCKRISKGKKGKKKKKIKFVQLLLPLLILSTPFDMADGKANESPSRFALSPLQLFKKKRKVKTNSKWISTFRGIGAKGSNVIEEQVRWPISWPRWITENVKNLKKGDENSNGQSGDVAFE